MTKIDLEWFRDRLVEMSDPVDEETAWGAGYAAGYEAASDNAEALVDQVQNPAVPLDWKWNTWDYVHCVECGRDLERRPRTEPEHFCSQECAYSYGVNFNHRLNEGEVVPRPTNMADAIADEVIRRLVEANMRDGSVS